METILSIGGFGIELFIVGVVPIIYLTKEESLFYPIKSFKLSIPYNLFAAIFASSIFISSSFSSKVSLFSAYQPTTLLIYSFLIFVLYFILHISYYEFIKEESSKDLRYEIKKFEAQKEKSIEDKAILKNLVSTRNKIVVLVVVQLLLYIGLFSGIAAFFSLSAGKPLVQ